MIKNFSELATTPARQDALSILEAGYVALSTAEVIRSKVWLKDKILHIAGHQYDLDKVNRLLVVGIGKCSLEAAMALETILGNHITDGVVIDMRQTSLKKIRTYLGTHPLPSQTNVEATNDAIGLVKNLATDDLLICLISGGGSALFAAPYMLSIDRLKATTDALMKAGASIQEMNTVRKHLSQVEGGQFAVLAHPAQVVSLIFSDVPGNDISFVASGPTVLDRTTIQDAEEVIMRYNILSAVGVSELTFKETPKDPVLFEHVTNELVVSNEIAVTAMGNKAAELGYSVRNLGWQLQGEASQVGQSIIEGLLPGQAVVAGGETTVTVQDAGGHGGRNQETVLGVLPLLKPNMAFISAASDGEDNGDRAGAIADHRSLERCRELGEDYNEALRTHSSYDLFAHLNDQVFTGKTGTNVSDLFIALNKKS
jgi:glycerate 2-kinase